MCRRDCNVILLFCSGTICNRRIKRPVGLEPTTGDTNPTRGCAGLQYRMPNETQWERRCQDACVEQLLTGSPRGRLPRQSPDLLELLAAFRTDHRFVTASKIIAAPQAQPEGFAVGSQT